MKHYSSFFTGHIKPYFLIIIMALIAYLPVALMVYSLKNDVLSLEYPIQYFISECIHNGIMPLWFNTWAMGFPLEGIITWSIFSPLQLIFATIFHFSLYTLHIEFLFYICLSGCTMFYFLKKQVLNDKKLSWLFAVCYMLSGFTVASSQWLLDITGVAFLPLIISTYLDLLKTPSWKKMFLFSAIFYCMLTGVYAALNIITVYILVLLSIYHIINAKFQKAPNLKTTFSFLGLTATIIILISGPALYSTFHLLSFMERGAPITSNNLFYLSNYFHPAALSTLLLPLPSVRMHYFNTEGTLLNIYIGIFPLLLLFYSIFKLFTNKDAKSIILFAISIVFLFISFGHLTPLRETLNIFPGFSYFRHAGLFRIYFIFFLILFLAYSMRNYSLKQIFRDPSIRKLLNISLLFLGISLVVIFLTHLSGINHLILMKDEPLRFSLTHITENDTIVLSSIVQLIFILMFWFTWNKGWNRLFSCVVCADVIVNTLLCIPYFTVSSYPVSKTEQIFQYTKNFPVQQRLLSRIQTKYTEGNSVWENVNVFSKNVSAQDSYWGPLKLKSYKPLDSSENSIFFDHRLIFSESNDNNNIKIKSEYPNFVSAVIETRDTGNIYFLQNFYPGWEAFINKQRVKIDTARIRGMKVHINKAGLLEFKYRKPALLTSIWIVQFLVLSALFFFIFLKIKSLIKSSFLSSLH